MPSPVLPETTLPAPAVVPPIVLPLPCWVKIPKAPLATAAVPAASVPIKFPATISRNPSVIKMPTSFPEMTLPAPAVAPPITLPRIEPELPAPEIETPYSFPMEPVPLEFVPIRLP
jgi:hypothetical protein